MKIKWGMVPEISSTTNIICCYFGSFFALLLTNNPKNQKFEKMKKTPKHIIILHMCTINGNHMMYAFVRYWAQQTKFFVILDYYLPFYPPNNPKNQNFEKLKKMSGDIIILNRCNKNHDHMLYCSLNMTLNRCNCYFSFWAFFSLLPL